MDDLGSSVSRSSFTMMILKPYSLGRRGDERGEESKYEKKSMTINSTIYEKYNNGFREGIEGSNAQISQVPSRPRSI